MKKLRNIAISLVFLLLIVSLAACGQSNDSEQSSIERIKERGVVRIGVFGDKPPFGYIDENGENQGFDVYIAKRFAKDLLGDESKIEFVTVEAANRVEYIQSDKVDILLANFTVTPERAEAVDFANPYMKVAIGVVSPDNAVIENVEDLKGKKLIVNRGTTAEIFFTENYPEIELVVYDQNTEAFNALKDGRGDALAHDNTMLFAWANQNKGYTVGITSIGNEDTIAPAVKKGDTELLNWINDELAKLGEENFMHEAYEATLAKEFGDDIDADDVVIEGGQQ